MLAEWRLQLCLLGVLLSPWDSLRQGSNMPHQPPPPASCWQEGMHAEVQERRTHFQP